MRRLLVIVMMSVMVVSMAACGTSKKAVQDNQSKVTTEVIKDVDKDTDQQLDGGDPASWSPTTESDDSDAEIVQIPSNFVEVDSLDAAKDIAGFTLTVPDAMDGYTEKNISVLNLEDKMIQLIFSQDDKEVVIRKESIGKDGVKDISGDYNEYVEKREIDCSGNKITLAGNEGKIFVATWSDDSFNYSVGSTDGFTQDKLIDLVSSIQ